jgi:hypothetical protein
MLLLYRKRELILHVTQLNGIMANKQQNSDTIQGNKYRQEGV